MNRHYHSYNHRKPIREGRSAYSGEDEEVYGDKYDDGDDNISGGGLYDTDYGDDRPEIYKELVETELVPQIIQWCNESGYTGLKCTSCEIEGVNRRLGAFGFVEFSLFFQKRVGAYSETCTSIDTRGLKRLIQKWGDTRTNEDDEDAYENCGDIIVCFGTEYDRRNVNSLTVNLTFGDTLDIMTVNESRYPRHYGRPLRENRSPRYTYRRRSR